MKKRVTNRSPPLCPARRKTIKPFSGGQPNEGRNRSDKDQRICKSFADVRNCKNALLSRNRPTSVHQFGDRLLEEQFRATRAFRSDKGSKSSRGLEEAARRSDQPGKVRHGYLYHAQQNLLLTEYIDLLWADDYLKSYGWERHSVFRAVSEALESEDLRDHAIQITEELEQAEAEEPEAEPTEEGSDFELSM